MLANKIPKNVLWPHCRPPLRSGYLTLRFVSAQLNATPRVSSRARASRLSALAAFAFGSAACLTYYRARVYNDAQLGEIEATNVTMPEQDASSTLLFPTGDDDSLDCLVWGSNTEGLLKPGKTQGVIKTPEFSPALLHSALRSLALHERHGACIDARGDLYQWGKGFSGTTDPPKLTLGGKDITDLVLTESKVFALSSRTGKIFLLASNEKRQEPQQKSPGVFSFFSWILGYGSSKVDFQELSTNVPLASGEKFTSISRGIDHLVALTSKGRTFSLPVAMSANSQGQLGFRKASVNLPELKNQFQEVELNPILANDPYANVTSYRRPTIPNTERSALSDVVASDMRHTVDDTSIHFCTRLTEIPSLRGQAVTQVVAGDRSTYALVDGRVLSWGANEYGQLGLGANVTLPYVTVPTEIAPMRTGNDLNPSRCTSICAAGDTAYFVVQRKTMEGESSINEVYACGQGKWGSLGHGRYTSAQGQPTRVRAVSGIVEYSESEKALQPLVIHNIVASPTGHAFITFDTLTHAGPGGVRGRDLVSWGLNRTYELGNGKRTNQAVPANLQGAEQMPFMLREKRHEVRDMSGKWWKRSAIIEQVPVAGYGCTVVYWKIKQ